MKTSLGHAAQPQRLSRPRVNDRPHAKTPAAGGHPRRRFLSLAAGAAALPTVSRLAGAQVYPTRPVRVIVPFAAGGPTDIIARLIGESLAERLGRPFIIENRPGGGGNIGTEAAVRAPADGHTLLAVATANAINATLYDKLNFNFLRDIRPVASINRTPLVMVVNPSVPAGTVSEFIAYARVNPGKISMASTSTGTPGHVTGELFKMLTGMNMVHVPYGGTLSALTDLIGGQVQTLFLEMTSALEHVRSGRLRALAVTSATRSALLPDVPTMGEYLPGFEASFWSGLGAPKNTPDQIVLTLNREINACLADPRLRERIAGTGTTIFAGSAGDFGQFVADETEKWAKVIKFCCR
jgi:tripartite-type tricarboxylate transporter receptor subunit TctC